LPSVLVVAVVVAVAVVDHLGLVTPELLVQLVVEG
jgi:hypothetical protein